MIETRRGMAEANGLQLAYEEFGDPAQPPLVLIMGFSAQMIMWPAEFCERLASNGYRVIRFDNRDVGLSTKLSGLRVEGSLYNRMIRSQLGLASPVPYTLHDMADDVRGLLDHLDIPAAHVVGASMGGMIAQVFAARHPDRVQSLGIVFSSTNQPLLPPPNPGALKALIFGPPPGATPQQLVEHSARCLRVIGSPGYPASREQLLADARAAYDRSYHPAGVIRQLAAVLGTGSLKSLATQITKRTVVIHGAQDPLLKPACGRAVARAIPNARLHLIDGMGHDLPPALWDEIVGELVENSKAS